MIINSRHDKNMPMNSEFLFDMTRIIRPKKLVVPYYTLGVENVAWVEGITGGDGDRSKQATNLYLLAGQVDSTASWSYSTVLVDLTNIKTLFIDWENTGDNIISNRSYFQVSTTSGAAHTSSVANLLYYRDFARRVDELDVSAISGEYHVIVLARDQVSNELSASEIRTYRVWGEG